MPIFNSKDKSVIKDYSTEELIQKAKEMRSYSMISIHAAGSGHPGGTLSIMDIVAALYLKIAKHDPENPEWEERDRIFWSAGLLYNGGR
jgi:transketolase